MAASLRPLASAAGIGKESQARIIGLPRAVAAQRRRVDSERVHGSGWTRGEGCRGQLGNDGRDDGQKLIRKRNAVLIRCKTLSGGF